MIYWFFPLILFGPRMAQPFFCCLKGRPCCNNSLLDGKLFLHVRPFWGRCFRSDSSRWRPYHVECTGSLLTSEVKRHRARLVLGWGTAWEDLRVLPAQQTRQGRGREERGRRRRRRKGKGEGEGKGKGKRQRKRQRPSGLLPLPLPLHLNCHNRQIPVIAMLAVVFVELQKATHLGYSIHPRCRCAAQHG